ncbi:nuclear transport factor 2 family protein [Actinopolymorpha pittospori]|uniref:SnoaL-like aldol condensation-catalyzing enzyme n=1 Tax=Actinopolymorpha pittospori TaxID=648752 RepID=A0A927RAU0_9ACTN|nr:nuclear transport factor 2 family protein [Actinopolymorpha pittospori]MBE1609392.1 putative SnoaL-like aldol condensation-catalyzing enzyme [Actinopolymorpha pittospori]
MTSTPTTSTDRARPVDNRALVLDLLARFGAGDLDGAADLLHDEFVSHNPRVPHDPATSSGRDAFTAFFEGPVGQALLAATSDVRRVICDGEYVVVHHRIVPGRPPEVAAVDIFRVQDGRIAEHWDVVQPVPETPVNPHGMF